MNWFPHHEQDFAFRQVRLTLRSAIGITQTGLAGFSGVSRCTIGDWEAGNTYPKAEHLKQSIAPAVNQRALTSGHEKEEVRKLWGKPAPMNAFQRSKRNR